MQSHDAGQPRRQLLLSIHDVTPDTLDDVEPILSGLSGLGYRKVTLLVVPGSGWTPGSLKRLQSLRETGAEFAGHGWRHVVDNIRGLRHRLHSLLISRDVAEHLALSRSQACELVQRCYGWFADNGLPKPGLYVPPAWAMGPIGRDDLDRLPFRRYETLAGIYDSGTGNFRRTAMIGFEADTPFRALSCRVWNRWNLRAAGTSKPIRVAIHPRDLRLLLAEDLRRFLESGGEALSYQDIDFHN
ncbi:MAG TPA: polysaccharide deacetylase family protein [Woeseiaceae bacterium]|nr:polysaccharide deacetylase family protein [Woeseiaceae bacterium]